MERAGPRRLTARVAFLAIYDLSIPEGILPGFGLVLGRVGGPDFTLKRVRELLDNAKKLSQDKNKTEQLDEAIANIDKDPAKAGQGLLADDWYKSVPWTQKALNSFGASAVNGMPSAPAHFTLADIDYKKATINNGLFKKSIKYLTRFGLDLSKLELTRNSDGSYTMNVKADPAALDGSKLPHPAMLADTQNVLGGFWTSVEQTAGRWSRASPST